jgi:MerR family transcriptional regulator/heat shock protein HspR
MREKKEATQAKSYYHISSVSKRYSIHPQTLRLYEREGLLTPSRSEGNTRLYTDDDLKQLELILNLIRDLGVNLAGVEVILNMRQKIQQIEAGVNEFLEYVKQEFVSGREEEFENKRNSLVPIGHRKIVKFEKKDT